MAQMIFSQIRQAPGPVSRKVGKFLPVQIAQVSYFVHWIHAVLFFLVKHKKKPALATRVKDERWSVYSFKRGMQQLPDRLEEEASQRKEAELLKDTPCSPLQWKDGKFLVGTQLIIE